MARAPKSPKAIDALKHDAASRRNIPTAEMESFFRRDEDSAPMPPRHYPRARPLPEGRTRTAEEPSAPELIWNGARITITDEQMAELAETGTLTLSDAQPVSACVPAMCLSLPPAPSADQSSKRIPTFTLWLRPPPNSPR